MESALYLIFKMYFDTSGMKESDLTENAWKKLGEGLHLVGISANYRILGNV